LYKARRLLSQHWHAVPVQLKRDGVEAGAVSSAQDVHVSQAIEPARQI